MKKNNSSSKKNIPEPPKKPMSSFFRYLNDNREMFKKKNPEVAGKGLLKLISKEWNSLSEAQTKKFIDIYEKDKAKYEIEKKAYEDKYGPIVPQKKEKKITSTGDEAKKRGRKSTKDKK